MKAEITFKLYINRKEFSLEELRNVDFKEPWKTSIQSFILDFISPSNTISAHTSGSTGNPKEIKLLKQNMANSAALTANYFDLKENSAALLCLSAEYIAGKMMIARALTQGWSLYCVEPSTNPIDEHNYNFCAMVPMQAISSQKDLSKIETLIIGGGALSPTAEEELLNTNHKGLYQTFGMTETTSHIAIKKLGTKIYHTLESITVSETSENALIIHAPRLLETDLQTNDIVEVISPTSFIWKGRKDNVINSGGIKIHPELIEHKIGIHLQSEFFIAGTADQTLGEKVVLFIEGKRQESIISTINNVAFDQFEKPKHIVFIPEFVRTDSGKVIRKKSIEQSSLK